MAVIAMPTTLILGRQLFRQRRFDLSEVSEVTGKQATRLFGPPKWGMSIGSPSPLSMEMSAIWEGMLMKLRGSINVLSAWDVNKPVPRGTMRGSPTLLSAAAAGAVSLSITGGGVSTTLKMGDWLQVGAGFGTSQLVKVTDDMVFSITGLGTVFFEPPIRKVIAGGAAVTWNMPLGHYRLAGNEFSWNAVAGAILSEGYGGDFMEDFG